MGGSGRAKRAMPMLAMMKPSRTWGTRIVLVRWSTGSCGFGVLDCVDLDDGGWAKWV